MKNYKHIWTSGSPHAHGVLIRNAVFVDEQGFSPEIEHDELDAVALHIVLYENDVPIAAGRIVPQGANTFRFGRIAVSRRRRGEGLGTQIMQLMEEKVGTIDDATPKKILLSAQAHSKGFYEKCGYYLLGDEYLIHGVAHIDMANDV